LNVGISKTKIEGTQNFENFEKIIIKNYHVLEMPFSQLRGLGKVEKARN